MSRLLGRRVVRLETKSENAAKPKQADLVIVKRIIVRADGTVADVITQPYATAPSLGAPT